MPQSLRLTKNEEKELYERCRDINKVLISKEKIPLRESELAHFILGETIKLVKVDSNGELYMDV